MTEAPAPHCVRAYNIAATSENKIHDDTVAARFGFAGALVPGVAVFGYMAHLPVAHWGRAWLERGSADCRFADPVYDGREVVAQARREGDELAIDVHSEGRHCASGRAALPAAVPAQPPALPLPASPLPPTVRPPAGEQTLAAGTRLSIRAFAFSEAQALQWLEDLRESDAIYRRERLLHPATLLRVANWVLTQNVVLGPWIHVGSTVRNHAALPWGAEIGADAVVTRNYQHKGHRFVELDIRVLLAGRQLAAQIEHTAIYLPRQVAEAAKAPPA